MVTIVATWDYETYPKCFKCGSYRLASYKQVISNPPPDSEEIERQLGHHAIWGSENALLHMAYVCLDCGDRDDDLRDFNETDERKLP